MSAMRGLAGGTLAVKRSFGRVGETSGLVDQGYDGNALSGQLECVVQGFGFRAAMSGEWGG